MAVAMDNMNMDRCMGITGTAESAISIPLGGAEGRERGRDSTLCQLMAWHAQAAPLVYIAGEKEAAANVGVKAGRIRGSNGWIYIHIRRVCK